MNTMKTLTVLAIAMSALAVTVGSSQAMTRGGSSGFHGYGGHGPSSGMHKGISCFACNLPHGGYGGYRDHHGWDHGERYRNYGYWYRNYRYGYSKPWRFGYWSRYWNRWSYWPRPVVYEVPVTPVAATPVAPIATPAVLAPAPVADAPVADAPAPAPAVAITCSAAPGAAITCSAVAPPAIDAH